MAVALVVLLLSGGIHWRRERGATLLSSGIADPTRNGENEAYLSFPPAGEKPSAPWPTPQKRQFI